MTGIGLFKLLHKSELFWVLPHAVFSNQNTSITSLKIMQLGSM